MRKLIESTLVSLDGVIEAPERWANFDAEATALSLEQLGNYDAFVMGRVTYQKFYANWGHTAGNPYIDRINAMPKYVASRSLTQTAWNATLLGPDPSSAIARLKGQPGKDLIKYGTSRFDDTLVRDHLIDEFRFWIMPVVAGWQVDQALVAAGAVDQGADRRPAAPADDQVALSRRSAA